MKKLNRKGFTLVELLAVIVILAVVALIGMNAVIPMMNEARANAFKQDALEFLSGAEAYYSKQAIAGGTIPSSVSVRTLVSDGYVKKSGIDKYSGCINMSDSDSSKWTITVGTAAYKITSKTVDELSSFDGKIQAADSTKNIAGSAVQKNSGVSISSDNDPYACSSTEENGN